MNIIQVVVLVFAVIIFAAITLLFSKQKYSSGFSLIWILLAIIAIAIGLFPRVIDILCGWLGIDYPPTLVFLVIITALIIIAFYTYTKLALLQQKLKTSSMEIALLADEIKELRSESDALKNTGGILTDEGTNKD